jgi:hypothetical protein
MPDGRVFTSALVWSPIRVRAGSSDSGREIWISPSRGRTTSPATARHRLAGAIAQCGGSGRLQGQRWLAEVHAYVQALPCNDRRLTMLACGTPGAVEEFVAVDGQPLSASFDPSAWLDRYLWWSGCGSAPRH